MGDALERFILTDNELPITQKTNWRGFTLQLFLITILPLSILLLIVAFGSQSLHHEAMRSLVGDRDLRTVRAASGSLEREISHLSSTIQILSRDLNGKTDISSLILSPLEVSSIFDGGVALFTGDGTLVQSSEASPNWQALPPLFPGLFSQKSKAVQQTVFSNLVSLSSNSPAYIFVGMQTSTGWFLVGASSPARLIQASIGDLASSSHTSVMVIAPANTTGKYDVLFRSGPFKMDESTPTHPGIREALNGESGINYFQSSEGEHVIAFNPIVSTGWGLIIEEAWEDIASPYLMNTQSAPLLIVPVFLLSLLAILFGARSIVTPLQKLERLAADLAAGNFDAIRQTVGGIEEIRNLQSELIEMADKLKAAQQSLRSYIGAITASVENERRSLARELHDDTIQSLIALNQRLQLAAINVPDPQKNSLVELQDLIQQSMINLRRVIRGLRPIYLEDLGLVASLEMLVREMEESSSLPISFEVKGSERRLNQQSEMSIYRMVQESLNNVIHHAAASHAWVELIFSDSDCLVTIRDDGKGFVVPENPAEFPKKGHFGLLGLQERAELINAELRIDSKPSIGTSIHIHLADTDLPSTN